MTWNARTLLSSILVLCSMPAAADTVVLGAIKDNTLYEILPGNATEGNGGLTSNGAGDFFFAGTTGQMFARRGLLAFDVASAVPAGAVITEVTLTLEMSRTLAGPETIELHRVLADWGEGTSDAPGEEGAGAPAAPGDATWLHTFYDTSFWGAPGGDFVASASADQVVAGSGAYIWGSTPEMVQDVQGWLDDPSTSFGWLVLGNESTAATAKRFHTRENGTGVPQLTVTFQAPVPAMPVWMQLGLIVVLAALALWRLRPHRPTRFPARFRRLQR